MCALYLRTLWSIHVVAFRAICARFRTYLPELQSSHTQKHTHTYGSFAFITHTPTRRHTKSRYHSAFITQAKRQKKTCVKAVAPTIHEGHEGRACKHFDPVATAIRLCVLCVFIIITRTICFRGRVKLSSGAFFVSLRACKHKNQSPTKWKNITVRWSEKCCV